MYDFIVALNDGTVEGKAETLLAAEKAAKAAGNRFRLAAQKVGMELEIPSWYVLGKDPRSGVREYSRGYCA
jgi:hypothetical protein